MTRTGLKPTAVKANPSTIPGYVSVDKLILHCQICLDLRWYFPSNHQKKQPSTAQSADYVFSKRALTPFAGLIFTLM